LNQLVNVLDLLNESGVFVSFSLSMGWIWLGGRKG